MAWCDCIKSGVEEANIGSDFGINNLRQRGRFGRSRVITAAKASCCVVAIAYRMEYINITFSN